MSRKINGIYTVVPNPEEPRRINGKYIVIPSEVPEDKREQYLLSRRTLNLN